MILGTLSLLLEGEDPQEGPSVKYCEVCGHYTFGGKPWCGEHVERAPVCTRIRSELEVSFSDRFSPQPSTHGMVAQDLLAMLLDRDDWTVGDLAHRSGYKFGEGAIGRAQVLVHLRALEAEGRVVFHEPEGRGKPTVTLP